MRRISCLFLCLLPSQFDPADQRVRSGMSVRTEMLCDGKTRRNLVDASGVFTESFPQSTPSLADVNGGAARAGDAVNETRGQTSKRVTTSLSPVHNQVSHRCLGYGIYEAANYK